MQKCLKCATYSYLEDGKCIYCEPYYNYITQGKCLKCKDTLLEYCVTCALSNRGEVMCLSCGYAAYVTDEGKCYCKKGYYGDNKKCIKCNEGPRPV